MITLTDDVVYILFGDTVTDDGLNICGVFRSLESAEEERDFLLENGPFIDYHIEEFGLRE